MQEVTSNVKNFIMEKHLTGLNTITVLENTFMVSILLDKMFVPYPQCNFQNQTFWSLPVTTCGNCKF